MTTIVIPSKITQVRVLNPENNFQAHQVVITGKDGNEVVFGTMDRSVALGLAGDLHSLHSDAELVIDRFEPGKVEVPR